MKKSQLPSILHQAADQIREGITEGRWIDVLPGRIQLSKELGISPATASRAIELLVQQGLLESQGRNRRAKILADSISRERQTLRIMMLQVASGAADKSWLSIQYELRALGMDPRETPLTLADLHFSLPSVIKQVQACKADGWVIQCGTREILQWFSEQNIPAFALAGNMSAVKIAGTAFVKEQAIRTVTRRLIQLGHTRIVILTGSRSVRNQLSGPTKVFLEEMAAHGIATSSYNLPEIGDNPDIEEIRACLLNLFRYTPPTALIVSTTQLYYITKSFVLETGRKIPKDVSLVVQQLAPEFQLDSPSPSHLTSDPFRMKDPLIQWAKNLAIGIHRWEQVLFPCDFVEGGSIGPVRNHHG